MVYILIAVLISTQGDIATLRVEFFNQKACLEALTTLATKTNASGSNIRAGGTFMCQSKG